MSKFNYLKILLYVAFFYYFSFFVFLAIFYLFYLILGNFMSNNLNFLCFAHFLSFIINYFFFKFVIKRAGGF